MNIVRKFRSSGSSMLNPAGNDGLSPQDDSALGLMHLKKLFSEYLYHSYSLSEQEKDERLYNMLPLFCKVFGNTSCSEIVTKFSEINIFCTHVSRLMVKEIKKRASNQSTEIASKSVAVFLEVENTEESSSGWMLLSTINLLSAIGEPPLIEAMTSVSLPSTLVKCLYLLFDLPELEIDDTQSESAFTPKERRVLLQKIFVQLLVRLCSHVAPAEELCSKNDLMLLFSAITSWCPVHNIPWRKSAAELLMTISRHGLTVTVVSYIHNKGCIKLCIDNMRQASDLNSLEIIEMFVTIFCFLKDSAVVSPSLLHDFKLAGGYPFLQEFLLSVNLQEDVEAQEALKNLVLMISSLCMCGFEEMRPSHIKMNSVFQLLGFKPPQPTGKGVSVRNAQAFQVLQTVFINSEYMPLCSTILDAINAVYHSDNSNYFILESFNTLSEISKVIHKKTPDIQVKFFRMVEFLVFQLNFVPCKELTAVASILKEDISISCSIACIQTLQAIMNHNQLFKEVYREVGILEVLSTCFILYSERFLSETANIGNNEEEEEDGEEHPEKQLVFALLEALTSLLTGNVNNASEFRKTDGAKRVNLLVGYDGTRKEALKLIRELIISTGGEEDMTALLGCLHSVSNYSLNAKIQIHKCLLSCLRESHRCRATFRKIGGFVYMMSDLVSMEGFLSPQGSRYCSTEEALNLLYYIFSTITVAMRFEPANAKYFHNEICMPSLCDALRLLGCFSNTLKFENSHRMDGSEIAENDQSLFHHLFTGNIPHSKIPENIPTVLANTCLVMRMLYDIAVDNYDKQNKSRLNISFKSPRKRLYEKERSIESSGNLDSSGSVESLRKEPVVVHAGIVSAMFQLLPAIEFAEHQELSDLLKLYVANVIKSLLRSERNQQVMCKIGFPERLLSIGKVVLENEIHMLHESLQYIIERLATQSLEPRDLREFLRLGDPLNCIPVDHELSTNSQTAGGPVPICRVKTLVSMTTSRDTRSNGMLYSSYLSPFVEMDMCAEGFGCLYLPSIAPQFSATSSSTANVGTPVPSDVNVNGGIGLGDRIFPPATGLSFSTWICIERFSDVSSDAHPIRLLTIVRHVQSSKDEHLICLSIMISARDKSIIINTSETSLNHTSPDWEPEVNNDYAVRLLNTERLQEGQWHHLVFVFNRSVLKNSSFCMYLDGQHFHTQKLHYITQNPGGASANLTVASSVYAYIGTPPLWRKYSRLLWKQGSCHLVEDVFNPSSVNLLYKLGPHYFGCLQATRVNENSHIVTLAPEERVMFGLNAKSVSQLTLAKIRKIYSRVDNKSIAKQLGMSSHENATPIHLVHNTAGYMSGSSRTIGGVVIGYLGTRCFYPKPASKVIDNIGGYSVLLGLVAMSKDVESLYAALKALVSVTRTNVTIQMEMDRRRGYQMFAMLLRSKKHLLNSHILHLVFNLIGTLDSGRENSSIPNVVAFQDILCDLDIWVEASGGLERTLFEHFMELLTESTERRSNLRIMRDMRLLQRLLYILPSLINGNSRQILFSLLRVLLANQPTSKDLLSFGQFIVATLPTATSFNEKNVAIVDDCDDISVEQTLTKSECKTSFDLLPFECIKLSDTDEFTTENKLINKIYLRNQCLQLIYSLLCTKFSVCPGFAEELVNTLGFDWVMLFAGSNLHKTTVIRSFRILFTLCSMSNLLIKFRDGLSNGGWLTNTELISHNKLGVLINCQESVPHGYKTSKECRMGMLNIPGFQQLFWFLPPHIILPEIYLYLIGLMLGQYVKEIPQDYTLEVEHIWKIIFGIKFDKSAVNRVALSICPEAITLLFKLVRIIMNGEKQSASTIPDWLSSYPVSIVQLIFILYQEVSDFIPVLMMPDIINSLAATLFYISNSFPSESSTPAPTPTSAHDQFDYSYVSMTSSDVTDNVFTDHPAKKFIIDFLRVIIFDSFLIMQNSSPKITPVLDLVLEATPESVDSNQIAKYQTEILSSVMDHLIDNDVLTVSTNNVPHGNIQHIPNNVSYFTSRLVDKLWQGLLLRDSLEIYEFIMKLISMTKRKNVTFPLEELYRSLNRTILYLLSRETDNVASQIPVLDTLHKIASHRNVVFGSNNHDLEFVGCLIYCLLQLTRDLKILLDTNIKTTWHVNPQYTAESEELTTTQGQNLMAVAAKRVWRELYLSKKSSIEEVFKISLPAASVDGKVPDLIVVRELIFEVSSKLWMNYVDTEKRGTSKVQWEFHNHLQSKIQKVTGGLTRLASRSKVKREETVKIQWPKVSRHDFLSWTVSHISSVIELTEFESRRYSLNQQHMLKYVTGEWLQIEAELTRERGLWGPEFPNSLDKWMLDATEGPSRMRKRMMRNDDFYLHYPYRPYLENEEHKSLKYKVALSLDSKKYFQIYRPQGLFNIDKEPPFIMLKENSLSYEEISQVTPDIINNAFHGLKKASTNRSTSELDDAVEDSESDSVSEDATPPTDNQALIRLLDKQEKISHMFRTARIQGLDKIEGLLLFGKENMYIVDGFTILKSREIRDIESLSAENYEPILPSPSGNNTSSTNCRKQCSKLLYEDVREVHKRRYLLQPIALEIFFADGRNYLLAFPRKVRNKVYQRVLTHATAIADSAHLSVAGQKRTASVEQVPSILSNLIGEPSVTQRWVRGEISNFQYLMHLNTLAGRSYNDLMQYPVFPWILADYTSEQLDFSNPSTFRDFSKPMGAQTSSRLKEFEKRFKDWDDPHGETPPYHYGTHYSSAMIVCSYLVRMEPFTQHFLRLQGGHFDLADRMFNSIAEAWLSASKHNMADVKELIPEFFYLPEFLLNSNNFDLGCKQNGVQLNDIILPNWAKEDPREFIRIHRQALECDYVSQHLHEWIDLIFGYKQIGEYAVKSFNVFHHLFYEGNVDIYSIDDPLKKNATIGFINNFGQIPKQLFKKPHPSKKLNSRLSVLDYSALMMNVMYNSDDKLFFHHLDNLKPSLQPLKELKGAVGQIIQSEKGTVLAVEQNKILIPPAYNKMVSWSCADHSLRISYYDTERTLSVCELVAQSFGEIVACVCPNPKLIITGSTNSVVTMWSLSSSFRELSVLQYLYGHTDAITCLAVSASYSILISGSRDCTAIIWDLSKRIFIRQLRDHRTAIGCIAINETTGDIAICSGTWLHMYSVNGEILAIVNTAVGKVDRMQQILCVAFSLCREWDVESVVMTGSADGVVRMWSIDYVQVPKKSRDVSKRNDDMYSDEKEQLINDNTKCSMSSPKKRVYNSLIMQMNISTEVINKGMLMKSASESSLSEHESHQKIREKVCKQILAMDEVDCNVRMESKNDDKVDLSSESNTESVKPTVEFDSDVVFEETALNDIVCGVEELAVIRRGRNNGKTNTRNRKSECITANKSVRPEETELRPSKSDTNISESYVVLNTPTTSSTAIIEGTSKFYDKLANNIQPSSPCNSLKEGFKWQRQLIFRSKLTMHTSYDRRDNTEPASITTIAVSKDHRAVFVGDARGRIFSWCVVDQPGRGAADHWLKDEGADICTGCGIRFSVYERKHHCRNCGLVFCSKCSRFESEINRLRIFKPVRVCQRCYTELRPVVKT